MATTSASHVKQRISGIWSRVLATINRRPLSTTTQGESEPPGRLVLWLPATTSYKKRVIDDYLFSLPYFFGTMLDDPDLQTQMLATPGDAFLIVCPRQDGGKSNLHSHWLLVFLANNETIIKVNIIYHKQKFVLAKEKNVTLEAFLVEQETNPIERPFFISPEQLKEQMTITPGLPFPIPSDVIRLGSITQKTLHLDAYRRIPVFELDCSTHSSEGRQAIFDEARQLLTFGSTRIWRLWCILFESDSLKLVLEDIVYGSLAEYVRLGHRLESQLKRFALQMCEGIRYLEKFNFVHYRLSIDAFLLTYSYNIKLAIFGLTDGVLVATDDASESVERCRWLAPECLPAPALPDHEIPLDRVPYGLPSMVYTFGLCMWSMFHGGTLPYDEEPPENIRDRAYRFEHPPEIDEDVMPKEISEMCVHRCWHKKNAHRPTFKDIKTHLLKVQDTYHF